MDTRALPILYSLRQCPYAMRARLILLLAGQPVLLRDVVMQNKPKEMLTASPKGTVPILVLTDGTVLEESIDIMLWALRNTDPNNLLYKEQEGALAEMLTLIRKSDKEFVTVLNKYKSSSRYRDPAKEAFRMECEPFIQQLDMRLAKYPYLFGHTPSLADYAILPFVRQFSRVDRKWFSQSCYNNLKLWLEQHFNNPVYSKVMSKVPQWLEAREDVVFK